MAQQVGPPTKTTLHIASRTATVAPDTPSPPLSTATMSAADGSSTEGEALLHSRALTVASAAPTVSSTTSRVAPARHRAYSALDTIVPDDVFDISDDDDDVDVDKDVTVTVTALSVSDASSASVAESTTSASQTAAAAAVVRRRMLGLLYMAISAVLFSVMSLIGSVSGWCVLAGCTGPVRAVRGSPLIAWCVNENRSRRVVPVAS